MSEVAWCGDCVLYMYILMSAAGQLILFLFTTQNENSPLNCVPFMLLNFHRRHNIVVIIALVSDTSSLTGVHVSVLYLNDTKLVIMLLVFLS